MRRCIQDLIPDEQNANAGTERGAYMVSHSLSTLGAGRSIVVDKEGRVIAGNKTLQAATDLGLPVRVIETDGKELVVVQRNDLDLTEKKGRARQLAYADNRSNEVGLAWNVEQLLVDIEAGLNLDDFFRGDELDELLASVRPSEPVEDAEPQLDRAAELQAEWQTERGQVWVIPSLSVAGKAHRVMCGDSTNADDVARLMGGEKANLLVTDPPYNVGFDYAGTTDDNKTEIDYQNFCVAWFKVWQDFTDRQIVTPGGVNFTWWVRVFDIYHVGVWVKLNAITRGKISIGWVWEPVLFFGDGWKRERASDIFEYPITNQQGVANHPCPKPLTMWNDLITNYTDDEGIACDAFLGSGTTIVACEQTGRIGYGMEISPAYVAVILQRLKDIGLDPRLVALDT